MMIFLRLALFLLGMASTSSTLIRGETGNKHMEPNEANERRFLDKKCKKKTKSTKIKAEFDTDLFKATIEAEDIAPGQAKWTVKIDELDPSLCTTFESFGWHIHALGLVDEECNGFAGAGIAPECDAAGGHWDPSLACGPISQFADTTCNALTYENEYRDRCSTDTPSGCEYGDINGKVGLLPVAVGEYEFTDTFIQTPVADFYENLSIVLHCPNFMAGPPSFPKVACANFQRD